MIRLMWIVTVVWVLAVCGHFISDPVFNAVLAGKYGVEFGGAVFVWGFLCWYTAVIGVPVLIIGWVIAILVSVTKANRPMDKPSLKIPTDPGLYKWDEASGSYLKIVK